MTAGFVSFLVGNAAQFIEDEDVQFRHNWLEESGNHQLFLLKTGVWWLLTTNGDKKVPSGVSVSDQEALTSLMLHRANLPTELKERAAQLRKSLKKNSLALQRRFVTAFHPDFGYEAVVYSADDLVDSEWRALMDAIEQSFAADYESMSPARYRFRISPMDASLGILAGLASRWEETKDIRNAVYFDYREFPGGFAKRNEPMVQSRERADALDRVAAKVERCAKCIRELRESAGTASISETPFVPLRDAKSVKVLDLDSGKEVWLQLDEFKKLPGKAFKDYVDEKTDQRICERETILISAEETYHLYVERDNIAIDDISDYSGYTVRRLSPANVARWFLLSGNKVPESLREFVESDIYSPIPKEPLSAQPSERAEPLIDAVDPPAESEAETTETVESDANTPRAGKRRQEKLEMLLHILRIEGRKKGVHLAKRIDVEEQTFRNHYQPLLNKHGVLNDGDGYYLP